MSRMTSPACASTSTTTSCFRVRTMSFFQKHVGLRRIPHRLQPRGQTLQFLPPRCGPLTVIPDMLLDTARQEMTCADRQWAGQYEAGDVIGYTKGSRVLGIEVGGYARAQHVDQKQNLITVERTNREHQTYDPRRLHGGT